MPRCVHVIHSDEFVCTIGKKAYEGVCALLKEWIGDTILKSEKVSVNVGYKTIEAHIWLKNGETIYITIQPIMAITVKSLAETIRYILMKQER